MQTAVSTPFRTLTHKIAEETANKQPVLRTIRVYFVPHKQHMPAQELYERLVAGGGLAEHLSEAVGAFLGAQLLPATAYPTPPYPAAQSAPPNSSSLPPPPYQRLAQRVLLLLPDEDLLAFAARLLPGPAGGRRGRGMTDDGFQSSLPAGLVRAQPFGFDLTVAC